MHPVCPSLGFVFNPFLIVIFTHFKLCLAGAIHNFKWVELFRFAKMDVKAAPWDDINFRF